MIFINDTKGGLYCHIFSKTLINSTLFKLPHNCTHCTCQQDNAQNPPSQASVVYEPDVQLDLEKAEEPEIKLPTIIQSQIKQEDSRKTSTSASLTYAKAFDCVDHNKLWKILKKMGIPDHLTCLLRNLYRSRSNSQNWT